MLLLKYLKDRIITELGRMTLFFFFFYVATSKIPLPCPVLYLKKDMHLQI